MKTCRLGITDSWSSLRVAVLTLFLTQDLARVSEGEGGVGFLGNNWLSYNGKTSYSYADESFHNSAVLAVGPIHGSEPDWSNYNQKEASHTFALLPILLVATRVKILKHVGNHLLYEITCSPGGARDHLFTFCSRHHLLLIHLL